MATPHEQIGNNMFHGLLLHAQKLLLLAKSNMIFT